MKRLLFIILAFPTLALAACPDAGNNAGYVTPAGNGSKTGADWNNTFAGFGTTTGMLNLSSSGGGTAAVRGCTYYVAVGGTQVAPAYCIGDETCVLSLADSGTSVVTIQAPTAAVHGTNTGYTSAVLGQAVFGPIKITTDYWTINGAYRQNTGNPFADWFVTSSYGIMFANGSGSIVNTSGTVVTWVSGVQFSTAWTGSIQPWIVGTQYTISSCSSVTSCTLTGSAGTQTGVNFSVGPTDTNGAIWDLAPTGSVTIEYTDEAGPGNTNVNGCAGAGLGCPDTGILSQGGGSNYYYGYNHVHDFSVLGIKFAGETNDILEYNAVNDNCCIGGAAHHGGLNPAVFFAQGQTNLTIRYNLLKDIDGTAYIDWANSPSATATHNGVYIYGNVAWCNTGDADYNGNACSGGNGWTAFLGNTSPAVNYQNVFMYNNTIDSLIPGNGNCGVTLNGGFTSTFTTLTIQNNLFSSCEPNPPLCNGSGTTCSGTITFDSNSGYNVSSGGNWPWAANCNPSCTNSQTISSNPYVNAGTNTSGADNYQLAFDTATWVSLGSPYNVDLLGNTRTSSRGAFQFNGSPPPPALSPFFSRNWDWQDWRGL